ncbi:radical SAM/SPASM domain-containing protein [Intestinibacter sp.]
MDGLVNMDKFEYKLCEKAGANRIPLSGAIELLPLCNMDCEMCYIRLSKKEMESMGRLKTADEWIELAKEMKEAGTLFMLLTGGEPFLYPDFDKVYNALRDMGMIITLNTNGTLIDEKVADMLAKNKPRRVNITLYGGSNETYARLCKNPNGFDQTVNAIKLLKERNIDVKMNVSVVEQNKMDIEAIYHTAVKLDVPVEVNTYMYPNTKGVKGEFKQESRLCAKDAAKMNITIKYNTYTEESFMKNRIEYLSKYEWAKQNEPPTEMQISCRAGKSSFWIDWKGNMCTCVFLENTKMDVFENGFKKSWQYIIEETDKLFLPKKCVLCDKRTVCQVCVASVYCENGNMDEAPQYLCEMTEEIINILK